MSIFQEIGPDRFEAVIKDFYDKVFDDVMIGYFFFGKDKEKLIKHQIQFTSQLLGGPKIVYEGKPIPAAHRSLNGLRKPHFDRRQQILKETLEEHQVDIHLIEAWLDSERRLLPLLFSRSSTSK